MERRPRIGLTMRMEIETRRFYLGRDYCEALEALGAIPFHLSLIPEKNYIAQAMKNLDGILLPGSDTDVEPLRYGEEPHPKLGKVISEKDETDLLVLAEAEKLKMPVLAICFGMQILNIFQGGTLFQDIESQIPGFIKHEQGIPQDRSSHTIKVEEESLLSRLITKYKPDVDIKINSSHHQAIKKLGNNLKATAWAKDGVIECIEDMREDKFNFGVQWHPELLWKTDELSKKIFEIFIEQSTNYASKKL
ncbi:MAG: gamma-glutamyl-gamma-aminobutyrate hydrolase family protein [Acidobacteriota bacterium]|nr:gamma-glutamyl-gamma-aminobutyrate hydrolase family protein [Acidobacteriota bacterium]